MFSDLCITWSGVDCDGWLDLSYIKWRGRSSVHGQISHLDPRNEEKLFAKGS